MSKTIAALTITTIGIGLTANAAQLFLDNNLNPSLQNAQETAFLAATGSLTKIDFEDQNQGDIIGPADYAGITFNKDDGADVWVLPANVNFAARGDDAIFPLIRTDVGGNPSPSENIQATLDTPQFAFGLWLIDSEFDSDPSTELIQFFDVNDDLIAEFNYQQSDFVSKPGNGDDAANYFFGYISDTPIKRVVMNEATSGELFTEDTGWDDVYFGVPEPSTIALLSIAMAFILRRQC